MYQYLDDKQKRRLFGVLMSLLILLSLFVGVKAINAIKDFSYIGSGIYPSNVVTITGKGEVVAVPDIASFSFSVTESAKLVSDAQNNASKKMNSIIDALKTMGIDEKDIKTINYSTYPKYDYKQTPCEVYPASQSGMMVSYPCSNGKQVLTGYEVSQTVSVKIRKTSDAGAALTKVGDLGATNISGLDFVVDNIEKIQAEARDKAIADAKEKAKVLSKSLGIKLSKITSFYEDGVYPVMGMGFGADSMNKTMAVPAAYTPEIPAGENKIISNVSITYEVK